MTLYIGPAGFWTMAPLRYAASLPFLPFLGLRPHAIHPGTIQGKEGIKFCDLATLCRVRTMGLGNMLFAMQSPDFADLLPLLLKVKFISYSWRERL